MYGVQNGPILLELKGALLIQICFGENEMIMRFDDGQKITIMVDVCVPERGFERAHHREVSRELVNLLGIKIASARAADPQTLEVIFENGYSIRIADDSPFYESFTVEASGQIMVV